MEYPLVKKYIAAKTREVSGLGEVVTLADLEAALQMGTIKGVFSESLLLPNFKRK